MARGRSSGYEDQRELILQRAAELFEKAAETSTDRYEYLKKLETLYK